MLAANGHYNMDVSSGKQFRSTVQDNCFFSCFLFDFISAAQAAKVPESKADNPLFSLMSPTMIFNDLHSEDTTNYHLALLPPDSPPPSPP